MLKLQFKDRRRESVWLVDEHFTIGKAASNSLMIEDPSIESSHVEIINQSNELLLIKKTATGIVKVNDKDAEDTTTLKANDVITLGSVELALIDSQSLAANSNPPKEPAHIWSLHSNASWLDKNDFIINKRMTIGRDPSCDICLSLDYLSRKHVALEPLNGKLYIEDLNSSNGTYVNGQKISKVELQPGDKIKLDVLNFEVKGPSSQTNNDPHKTIIRKAKPVAKPQTASAPQAVSATARPQNNTKKASDAKSKSSSQRKRLASDGKQSWISGENQLKKKVERKSKTARILTLTALLIVAVGLATVLIL